MDNESGKPAVFVIDPYHEKAIEALQQSEGIDLVLPNDPRRNGFLQYATAVLLRSETKLTASEINRASPQLRYIVKQGVGVDNIDLNAAKERGIQVFTTPGINSEAVAELTIALAFCVARRVNEIDRMIRNRGTVVRSRVLGKSLFGKTIGVIGMGNIGVEVAVKWHALTRGPIVAYDPYAPEKAWEGRVESDAFTRVSALDELLRTSDVVTIHVPLTSATRHLMSAAQLAQMRKGAILLNCARGGIVDEAALLDALNADHLFGAGLDAVENEPPTLEHYGDTLLAHPRVVMTPHVGASTEENQANSGVAAVRIVLDLFDPSVAEKPRPLN